MDPGPLILLTAAGVLYWRAVAVLRRRGRETSRWRQAAFGAGLGATAVGLVGPVDALSEDLLSAHMVQHLLIADLAAPLLLAGMRTPVLQFLLPRPALVALARQRWLRRVLRRLRQPLVAIPLFVVTLYGWHFSFAFEAAMGSAALHALQHLSFVGGAILVWWPLIEPDRARMRGELWKMGHVLAARFTGMLVGMAFVITRAPVYSGAYGDRAGEHGLSPLADQQLAGGLMLSLDLLVVVFAMAFFFWRAGVEHDRTERATG